VEDTKKEISTLVDADGVEVDEYVDVAVVDANVDVDADVDVVTPNTSTTTRSRSNNQRDLPISLLLWFRASCQLT